MIELTKSGMFLSGLICGVWGVMLLWSSQPNHISYGLPSMVLISVTSIICLIAINLVFKEDVK